MQKKITGIYLFAEVGGLVDAIVLSPEVRVGRGLINGHEVAILASGINRISVSPYNPNHIIIHGVEKGQLPISLSPSNYLAIFDQTGGLIAYSDYCCQRCFQNSGQHVGRTRTIRCQGCGKEWELPRTVNLKGP